MSSLLTVPTIHTFPGGYQSFAPGAAAIASQVVAAEPMWRDSFEFLSAELTNRDLVVTSWAAAGGHHGRNRVIPNAHVEGRMLGAFRQLAQREGRSVLKNSVQRTIHIVETIAWGTSQWSKQWGALGSTTSREVEDVLRHWQRGGVPADPPAYPPQAMPWRPGIEVELDTVNVRRVELALALPVSQAIHAYAAMGILGVGSHGLLGARLRGSAPLAYGLAVLPLVRDSGSAVVLAASTEASLAGQCAGGLAALARQLVTLLSGRRVGEALGRRAVAQVWDARLGGSVPDPVFRELALAFEHCRGICDFVVQPSRDVDAEDWIWHGRTARPDQLRSAITAACLQRDSS